MSQDGKGQRIKRDISGDGVAERVVSCGGTVYDGPAGGQFRKCTLGHHHCRKCGSTARKYGRFDYSCVASCSLNKEEKES